ncbi:unnamed protein product, partial [marine sediment metagenome]
PDAEGINGEMQAFHIALKSAGVSVPFTTLMGVGGLAFRLYWHKGTEEDETFGQWSDTSLEAVSGTHPVYEAAQYSGWSYTPYNQNTLDDMYMLARQSIDNGIPAITRGPVGPPIPSLIIGYEEEVTRKLLILSKYAGDKVTPLEIPMFDLPLLEYGYWRNPIFILEPGMPPDEDERLEMIKNAIKGAAEASEAPSIDNARWIGGIEAYEAIATDLEGDLGNVMAGLGPEGIEEDPRVDILGQVIHELGRARGCAFEFLETFADDFPVEDAVSEYEDVYEKYLEIKKIFPNPSLDFQGAFDALF